jgi:hypothetical protein
MLPHATGGWIPKIIHRLWVVVILEIVSRAVLGYHLSFGREVSKEDILRTIKNALTRWTRKLLAFSDVPYCADANLPSGASEIFVGVCWDETSVDGALAQTCTHVRGVLQDIVNASLIEPSVGFSKRRSKDDRPFIETFFRTLGSRGFQRLTNTTGGDPKGKQGRNPENIAITSQFQLEYAQELLDVLIANYNATPHTNLGYRSPLAYLEFCAKSTDTNFRHADPNSVQQVLSFRKRCVVKGGYKKGRQPYINFESARYTSEFLSQRHDLVGSYIWITNHIEDDARMVQASTLDGLSLGILRAAPPWHRLPHSLKLRRAITSCVRRRMFVLVNGADGVESFIKFIEAQTNRKLPIHPAYLEARRILIQEAEQTTGESMLAVAKARALDSPPEPKQDKTGDEKRQNKPSSAKPPLPPMRQAATD